MNRPALAALAAGIGLGAAGGYLLGSAARDESALVAPQSPPQGLVQALRTGSAEGAEREQSGRLPRLTTADSTRGPAACPEWNEIFCKRIGELARLAATDPRAAAEQAATLEPLGLRRRALQGVAAVWAETDPEAVAEYAADLRDPLARDNFEQALLTGRLRSDPVEAVAELQASGLMGRWNETVYEALAGIAKRSPDAALEAAGSIGNEIHRRRALSAVFESIAEEDPRAAASRLGTVADRRAHPHLGTVVARAYAAIAPDEALLWATRLDADGEEGILRAALAGVARRDPDTALNAMGSIPSRHQRRKAFADIVESVAESDPALGASYLETAPPKILSEDAVSGVARAWLVRDRAGAMSWLLAQQGPEFERALGEIGIHMAGEDPASAAKLIPRLPEEAQHQWIQAVARTYARRDADAALDFLRRYREHPAHDLALERIVPRIAAEDIDRALELAVSASSDAFRGSLVRSALLDAGRRDPRAAMERVARLENPAVATDAASGIVWQWAADDPASARAWLLDQPPGPVQDAGLVSMFLREVDAGGGDRSLLQRISDPAMRERAEILEIRTMAPLDPEAAALRLSKSGMEGRAREQLEEFLALFGQ